MCRAVSPGLANGPLMASGSPVDFPTTPAGRMVLTVFAGLAEFERELIRERTGTGRIAAMKRGVRFGRPASLSGEQTTLARRWLDEGKSAREVAKTFGVHKATIYRGTAQTSQLD